MPGYDAVVWDLGGVLVDWDPRHLYRRLLGTDAEVEQFLTEVGFADWNHSMDAGERTWAEAVEALAATHPHRRDLIAAYPQRFAESLAGPIDAVVAILRELHARDTPLYSVTNWSAETFEVARERFDFLELFDGIVVSGHERVAKPDPAIFAVLLQRYRLDPAGTVFVDDRADNVDAAATAGLRAVRYTDPHRLRADLRSMGLLPPADRPRDP